MDPLAPYALVADDHPVIRMDAQAILAAAGFRVYAAAGVDDALEILASRGHTLRLLFTDVQMPPSNLTGIDLARRCARDWPEIGILVASGGGCPGPGVLPERARFISKPFSDEMVRHRLMQVLPDNLQPEGLRVTPR